MKNLKKMANEHSDHGVEYAPGESLCYTLQIMFNERGLSYSLAEYDVSGKLAYAPLSSILKNFASGEKDSEVKGRLLKAASGGLEVLVYGQHVHEYWCFKPISGNDGIDEYAMETGDGIHLAKKKLVSLLIG